MRKLKREEEVGGKWPGRFLFFHQVGIRWPLDGGETETDDNLCDLGMSRRAE